MASIAVEEPVAEQEYSFAMDASAYAPVSYLLPSRSATGIALPTPHPATEVVVPGVEDELLTAALLPLKALGTRRDGSAVPLLVRVPIGVECYCAEREQDLKITVDAVVLSSAL